MWVSLIQSLKDFKNKTGFPEEEEVLPQDCSPRVSNLPACPMNFRLTSLNNHISQLIPWTPLCLYVYMYVCVCISPSYWFCFSEEP